MELTYNYTNNLLMKPYIQQDIYHNPISNLAKSWETISNNPYMFSNEISYDFKITDQKSSGRCWIFATLNLIRFISAESWNDQMDCKDLEFSQSYLFFWDKFERYNRNLNYFLQIKDLDCQYFTNICKDPLGDGGQWDMAKEIVKKYGIVPKYIFPDSYNAKATASMNKILTEMLKQDWISLSKIKNENVQDVIKQKMDKVFEVLVMFLGRPPTKFNYEFKFKNKTNVWKDMTPLTLLEKSKFIPDDWISIVNDPRKENIYNKYYQVKYLGNVKDQHVGWLNLPIERMKELTKNSIDKNEPVWFGCDVGADRDKETGVSDVNIINYNDYLGLEINMTKEDRLRYYDSVPSHAMLITGYNKFDDEVNPNRWKVENSWGSSSGTNGFLLLTDKWFDEYLFQIVVHKNLLKQEEMNEIGKVHKVIYPWDPLGTLA